MCERTCPRCGCTSHFSLYGIGGSYLACEACGQLLANRADREAAPIDLTEAEVDAWWEECSGVLIGAEAKDPKDDLPYGPRRVEMEDA